MSKLPESYVEHHGCNDCVRVFIKGDYDDAPTWYCGYEAGDRPLCGSVCMKESFFDRESDKGPEREKLEHDRIEAWYAWSEGREVKPWGNCAHWRGKCDDDEKKNN